MKLEVDLGDLKNQKKRIIKFLESKYNITAVPKAKSNKVELSEENTSEKELQHAVTKFIYHYNLNGSHWASLEGKTVKIERFKESVKKKKEHSDGTIHQTPAESWGL